MADPIVRKNEFTNAANDERQQSPTVPMQTVRYLPENLDDVTRAYLRQIWQDMIKTLKGVIDDASVENAKRGLHC